MTLDELYVHAERLGIEVDDVPMRVVTASSYPDGWIAMDKSKIESLSEEKVLLAHEIGHIETGSFYNILSKYDLQSKCERRADKRAIQMLVPYKRLQRALRVGLRETWELAEHFEVTEDFMKKVVDFYKDRIKRIG